MEVVLRFSGPAADIPMTRRVQDRPRLGRWLRSKRGPEVVRQVISLIQGLNELLETATDLPTLPEVVFKLHAVLDNECASGEDIAAIIERDPAITTRLLRAANSAMFAGNAEISSVHNAVARLGIRQVRAVCIVVAVVKSFGTCGSGLNHQEFWSHSFGVGLVARKLWSLLDRGLPDPEEVYVGGLLHDVGLLILDQYFSNEFAECSTVRGERGGPIWKVEEELFGMDHGEVGGLLLGRWRLPAVARESVAHHHHPAGATEFPEVCRVVNAAEVICTARDLGVPLEGEMELEPETALVAAGFSEADTQGILDSLVPLVEQARGFAAV